MTGKDFSILTKEQLLVEKKEKEKESFILKVYHYLM